MVSALNLITPTELAYDLLTRLDESYGRLLEAEGSLRELSAGFLSAEGKMLSEASGRLLAISQTFIRKHQSDLDHLWKTTRLMVTHFVSVQKSTLAGMEGKVKNLDPWKVLQRGYSMTYDEQGRIVKNADEVAAGEKIHTELASGTIKSTVDL